MELKLKGKKALVTGSSSGIGEGIAKCLAREGVHVMVQGRKEQELQRVVQEITAIGGVAHYVEGDLTNDDDAKRIAGKTLETFQHLDILINNAGAFPKRGWLQSTPQDWRDLLESKCGLHGADDSSLPASDEDPWLGANYPNRQRGRH